MPATKVKSSWVSGNLVFKESVAGNGGQVIFGHTNGGVDVRFYGTTSSHSVLFDESANALIGTGTNLTLYGTTTSKSVVFATTGNTLTLTGVTLKLGNADAIQGDATASHTYKLNAWGTAASPVITIKNSTGNATVKLGFFGKTDGVRIATISAATTLSNVITGFNSLLAGLKVLGLCST